VIDEALGVAEPVSVRLYLHVLGRARPVRLELSADGENNSVEFDRDDPEVVAVVHGYMRARGILGSPGSDEAASAGEPEAGSA
jgi:hypothetical protein